MSRQFLTNSELTSVRRNIRQLREYLRELESALPKKAGDRLDADLAEFALRDIYGTSAIVCETLDVEI